MIRRTVILFVLSPRDSDKPSADRADDRIRGIAQPGSAEVLGTSGRRFESCCPDQHAVPVQPGAGVHFGNRPSKSAPDGDHVSWNGDFS
jgi:hypothetical protein